MPPKKSRGSPSKRKKRPNAEVPMEPEALTGEGGQISKKQKIESSGSEPPLWVQLMIQDLQFGEGHGSQLYSKLKKLPMELMKPSKFVSEDVMSNEAVVNAFGAEFVKYIHEKCSRTLKLYLRAEIILKETLKGVIYTKVKELLKSSRPDDSFEKTLLKLMVELEIQSLETLKSLSDLTFNCYFPLDVTKELLKSWNDPDSVAIWSQVEATKEAIEKPIVKIPSDYTSMLYDSKLLRSNNIEKTNDKQRFQPLLQKMNSAVEPESIDLTDDEETYLEAGEFKFDENCSASTKKDLLRRYFKLAYDRLEKKIRGILKRSLKAKNCELSHARGGYTGLYLEATRLDDKNFRLLFDDKITPIVPVEHDGKLYKFACRPDCFGFDPSKGCIGGVIEEKVEKKEFTENINKSIFLCFLQWKQFQLYGKDLDMGTLQLPIIVLHSEKLIIFGFSKAVSKHSTSGNPPYKFNYAKILELDVSKLTNYTKANHIMYNYFLFYKHMLSKCSNALDAPAYGEFKSLDLFQKSNVTKSKAESRSFNHQLSSTNDGEQSQPPSDTSGKGKHKKARDSELHEPETDTYELLCKRFHLKFRGPLPMAPNSLPLLEEAQVRDHGIFLAENESNTNVVVKFARFSHESAGYLQNEIDVIRKLSDAGYSSGAKYLASETIQSHKLVVLITSYCGTPVGYLKQIDFQKWLDLSEGLYNAVADIHQHGVIHCDLSLNNVCLLNNEIKIIDFGLSVYCDSDGKSSTMIRTRVTTAVDVYSVGMMLKWLWENVEKKCFVENNKKEMISELLDDLTRERVGERVTLEKALQKIDIITSKKGRGP